jgi:peptidoglycan/xylan/chitin deacetylase (PgdA/CDA1 family)
MHALVLSERADLVGPARDYVGYGRNLPRVRWPGDAKVAVNIVINYETGSERSYVFADPHVESLLEFQSPIPSTMRDLGAESIHEYESRAGIWRLLRLFDELGVKTTFFASAAAYQRNPAVAEAATAQGHETAFHGVRWEEPWELSAEQERANVEQAIEIFTELTGNRPVGCYWRYAPSVHSRQILIDLDFVYDSNAYNDDLPYFVDVSGKQLLVVPYTLTYNDGKFVMASGQGYGSPSDFVDYCVRALDELWQEGAAGYPKMMSIGLHPRWMGQAGRTSALREFIVHAQTKGDVWFARRDEIARWWLDHHQEFVTA